MEWIPLVSVHEPLPEEALGPHSMRNLSTENHCTIKFFDVMRLRFPHVSFKGTGHYWQLLKLLAKKSLVNKQWRAVDSFWDRGNFSLKYIWIWYKTSKGTQILCNNDAFLALFSCNFDDQMSQNVHRLVSICICWDTLSEDTGLWQLPKVYSAFKTAPKETTGFYTIQERHVQKRWWESCLRSGVFRLKMAYKYSTNLQDWNWLQNIK